MLAKNPRLIDAAYGKARALDRLSEMQQSNAILEEAIMAYQVFLQIGNKINDALFKAAAMRCIDRMRFKGQQLKAVTVHNMLINRFKDEPEYRNELAVTYLLANR